jgi:hypothetical protein
LIDKAGIDNTTGITVGADIDAVGAISTIPNTAVPEPSTLLLLGTGLALATRSRRRRRTRAEFDRRPEAKSSR